MAGLMKILAKMKNEPANVRFSELVKICTHFFGKPRFSSSSHMIFKTPWHGDPRVNIQNSNGKAKTYQVKQVLTALEQLNNAKSMLDHEN
ncbi:toxin HicA [Advenella mimigardefordensis]|uniref:Toxin HicA n=1 Tax=Advenella mimigardefordensis (strain DSM 17166 / LMG 22922 / DPN7) TaxID=1247726 RepID=W0PKY7_ADVMD|nr:toxin HicA [Advenella mimigardefordensis]AHG65658.1 hypothetical protein MIM_c35990 [Advenella mimigardefordensis DPN7]